MFYKIFKINQKRKSTKGFTLIELLVSISVFSIVLVTTMGAILTVLDANRKSQSMRAVMDNLNFTLEDMTRSIRFGSNYHCDATSGDITLPQDCANNLLGSSSLSILSSDGVSLITFRLDSSTGRIVKTVTVGSLVNSYYMTSPDTTITNLTFRVYGSAPFSTDQLQPKVIVVVSGYAGTKDNTKTTFSLETTLSQRKFDYQ